MHAIDDLLGFDLFRLRLDVKPFFEARHTTTSPEISTSYDDAHHDLRNSYRCRRRWYNITLSCRQGLHRRPSPSLPPCFSSLDNLLLAP